MNESDKQLLTQMIQESSEMWMQARHRTPFGADPIIICRNPERAFYLERAQNYEGGIAFEDGWMVEERPLKMADAAEFFSAFGSLWPCWRAAKLRDVPVRAFIKNGRKEGWSISLDTKTDPLSVANSIGALTSSLTIFQHHLVQANQPETDNP
jgi:hypothetical protein